MSEHEEAPGEDGHEGSEEDVDLSLYDGELRLEDGYLVRRWIDKRGQPQEAWFKNPFTHQSTGIEVSRSEDPRAYHREYYRRVRRYRDGRRPRVSDEPDVSK